MYDERQRRSTRVVLEQEFEDIESFGRALGEWDVDFRQLDRGPLVARAAMIAERQISIARVDLNRRFHQRGAGPAGIVALGLLDVGVRWCGVDAARDEVVSFNMPGGFDGTSEVGFSGYLIMCDEDFLREVACDLGVEVDLGSIASTSAWAGCAREGGALRRRLAAAFQTGLDPGADGSEVSEELGYPTVAALLGLIATGEREPSRREGPTARRRTLRTVLELLEDQRMLPLRVSDLCQAARVSAPTLYRAFQEEFGVSPKQYLQSRSLSGARRELLEASPGVLVTDVAGRWGFWHLSQFAADYSRQFGELPSATLARATGSSAS
jgi:AraC family ethanolamine operon transcriptional activator